MKVSLLFLRRGLAGFAFAGIMIAILTYSSSQNPVQASKSLVQPAVKTSHTTIYKAAPKMSAKSYFSTSKSALPKIIKE
jgi:hypothetical protein